MRRGLNVQRRAPRTYLPTTSLREKTKSRQITKGYCYCSVGRRALFIAQKDITRASAYLARDSRAPPQRLHIDRTRL